MADQAKKHTHGILSYLTGRKKLWATVLIGMLGVLLLLIGAGGNGKKSNTDTDTLGARVEELSTYRTSLEKEIETLCESVAGVSDCTVMVTLSHGYAVSYGKDGNGDPATVGSGSSEEALFDSVSPPTVAGVGIVCRGGRDARVQALLTELVATSLGISSARVYVTGK